MFTEKFEALAERMAHLDPSSPEDWREALTDYGNALIGASDLPSRARFARLVASGDLDAIEQGCAALTSELEELASVAEYVLATGRKLLEQYAGCQEYLRMAVSSRRPPEG